MTYLLFDLYGVIIKHRTEEIRREVDQRLGIDADHRQAFWDAYHDLRAPLDAGEVSDEQWWAEVAAAADVPQLDIQEAIATETDTLLNPYPEMVELVEDLISQGYQCGVLSNLPHVLARGLVEKHEWFKDFHSLTFSCDIGMVKPDAGAYYKALEELGATPEQTIFFDDTLKNIEAASALGIQAVHFTGPETVLAAINKAS